MRPGEIVVDNFAGGGGASTGIEAAIGRPIDVAINHDEEAVAMHRENHPGTVHLCQSVWKADPRDVAAGRPVGLAWFSPDCKHFSKAKGGKPVEKNIRDLAWVVVHWAKLVRPRIIMLENVEEFRDWAPLIQLTDAKGKPVFDLKGSPVLVGDPMRKGEVFHRWVRALRREGYKVEWRELRACDYGAPTIRKRLFIIARRDGLPIVWPKPTHAPLRVNRDGIVTEWARGHGLTIADLQGLKPYRTAAEIIDWSLPCPSIFLTREDARRLRKETGIIIQRPLAENTMARVAKGVKRYVIDAAEPFIVPITHAGDSRVHSVDDPLRTITTANRGEHALVTPFLARTAHGERDKSGKKRGRSDQALTDPAPTITTSGDSALVMPYLVPRYGEREGQEPRTRDIQEPLSTIVPTANGDTLVAPVLVGCGGRAGQSPPRPGDAPVGTQTTKADGCLVAAHLMTMRNAQKPFNEADKPAHTLTAGGANLSVVAAFLAQHNTDMVGHDAREPVSTIVGKGCTQAVVAAGLVNLKGTERGGRSVEEPIPTLTAHGKHVAEVRAFLIKYFGTAVGQDAREPLHTVTTKDRIGIVMVHGEPYQIVDIGMRMLTARERFNAQGFPPNYIIDLEFKGKKISGAAQGRLVGNSVCPPLAEALVRANYAEPAAEAVLA